MKKIILIFTGVLFTQTACDLQPKISSLPDSVGDFISDRYPALLADPYAQPEIYNSAVTDYGVYASPELYGTDTNDEYVMYASIDDYVVPPQNEESMIDAGSEIVVAEPQEDIGPEDDYLVVPMYGNANVQPKENILVVKAGDTLYKLAKENNTTVEDLARLNSLSAPYALAIGQQLRIAGEIPAVKPDVLTVNKPSAGVQTVTRVPVQEIVVAPGDTLYSLSRKYSVPVNDLALMNDLRAPFALSVGQKVRVPNLATVTPTSVAKAETKSVSVPAKTTLVVKKETPKVGSTVVAKNTTVKTTEKKPVDKKSVKVVENKKVQKQETKKISSDPTKKLPKITKRSSAKFTWPVRGKILSNYGAKSNGLFNDGINISATRGTAVKAAENGVVAYAGNEVKGMGNLIIIQHSDGFMTVYAHMDSMSVRRGVRVNVGQKIGTVGKTGKVDTPQLHFEIRKGTRAYNPTTYLKK
ncbi:MAG: LysM peptidoglycan-binding domain-containing M23 family metallopeptidase [Alphaproteobacteria bacterium]|nr:LysM peptidoglycan-binding domain-containing M23 family metallopeptidase [Alphaproteobacteria bacterium]